MGDKEEKLIYSFKKKTIVKDSESSSESEPETDGARNNDVLHRQDWRRKDDYVQPGATASNWRDPNNGPSNHDWRRRDNSKTPGSSASDWRSSIGNRKDSKESEMKQCSTLSSQEGRRSFDSPSHSSSKNLRGQRGQSDFNWRKQKEKNFPKERHSTNNESAVESFRGNWCFRAVTKTRDGYGKSEADRIWDSLNELHQENSALFPYEPWTFEDPQRLVRTVNCSTLDDRDVENIRNVARALRNRIYYPYVMYYFKHNSKSPNFLHSLEDELYEKDGITWKLMEEWS